MTTPPSLAPVKQAYGRSAKELVSAQAQAVPPVKQFYGRSLKELGFSDHPAGSAPGPLSLSRDHAP